jgi:hypothetical protein
MSSRNSARHWTIVALVLSVAAACTRTPMQPTSGQPAAATVSNPAALNGSLAITAFSVSGWYDGTFHYVLAGLSVAASDRSDLVLQRVAFTGSQGGVITPVAGITFGTPSRNLPAGTAIDLAKDQALSTTEFKSPGALTSVTVTVYFVDPAGHIGSVAADTVVPATPQTASTAALTIGAFTVEGWYEKGYFQYWPKLTLSESSGRSQATIKTITFELLDVGPSGRVPPSWNPGVVPAGGSITFTEDDYGGAWFSISSTAEASRVSMVISFVDDAGRGGVVSSMAQVSR